MTKANITQYDNTAANNTDVQDVPLGENQMYPADVNNAFREIMADLADVNDGTVTLTSPAAGSINITGNITVGGTVDGRDVATDGTKLDGIESNATADQSAAEIKTAYESNADTNAFTDADHTKLDGIASGAEVNTVDSVNTQTGAVVLDADDISDAATTNKFTTSADITKLAGIETGATADQTGSEIATALNGETLTGIASATVTGDLTVDTSTLHVDSTNNRVGIGTSSPSSSLTVASASFEDHILLDRTGIGSMHITATNPRGLAVTDGSSQFFTILQSSGDVLVGQNSGSSADTGHILTQAGLAFHVRDGGVPLVVDRQTSDGDIAHFRKDGSVVGKIGSYSGTGLTLTSGGELRFFTSTSSEDMRLETDGDLHVDGNVVAYSTTISDIRLKKDIAPIEDAVTKVQQLNGCTFTYLKDDRKSAGLIAQDVEKVLPSAVIEDEAVFHGEEGERYKTVQYDQLIGLLVEAVKELKAEIEELKDASSK